MPDAQSGKNQEVPDSNKKGDTRQPLWEEICKNMDFTPLDNLHICALIRKRQTIVISTDQVISFNKADGHLKYG